jgi:pyruvate dehydrogenase E1 component beta subunit
MIPMKKQMAFREAIAQALTDEMRADPRVFVFGLDVPDHKRIYGTTAGLPEEFGAERCFGTPLSEDAMTGVALGAAISGLRPVHVHIRSDFLLLGMNQIANLVSTARYNSGGKLRAPLVIRAVIGRGWGQGAQHSKSLHGVFAHIPGLKVVMPTSPQDAYSLLRSAIQDDDPVIFLEHRWFHDIAGEVDTGVSVPLGKAVVRRPGADISLICTSWMTIEALKAAEVLAKHGIQCEVVDVRSISPFDAETVVESVRKTGRCLVADYDWVFSGFGAEIAAQVSEACFPSLREPVKRVGFAWSPCPTTRPLESRFFPGAQEIIRAAEKLLGSPEHDLSGEEFYSYEKRFKGPF